MTAPATARLVADRAWRWWAVGASPVPVREDGSKAPVTAWKSFTTAQPTEEQMRAAFGPRGGNGRPAGFGLVLGVSGLECLETEDAATETAFVAACHAAGLGDLLDRVTAGYSDVSPGQGVHRVYRVATPVGNTKLASRREFSPREMEKQLAAGDEKSRTSKPTNLVERQGYDERGTNQTQVLIETRGQGGFIIAAPTGGPTIHKGKMPRFRTFAAWESGDELAGPIAAGRSYVDIAGSPEQVVTITDTERDALYDVARTLDEMPAPVVPERTWTGEKAAHVRLSGTETVGDWVNAHLSWDEVMGDLLGWTPGRIDGQWLRPGDTNAERSAVADYNGNDRLTIFSSAVDWAGTPGPGSNYPSHDKFGVIARALHGGDFTAAARWVAETYPVPAPDWTGVTFRMPTVQEFMANGGHAVPVTIPTDAHPTCATPAEVELWLTSATRFTRPARLGRRVEWMRAARPEQMARHAAALIADSLAGFYPAEKVVAALRDTYRRHGVTDLAVVHDLVAHALGAHLNTKVAPQ